GEMQEIGFNLYTEMLNRAVAALKAGQAPDPAVPLATVTEINLHTPALLPNDYAPDVHERLTIYKRLGNCTQAEELMDMQEELIDRFGPLPQQAQALLDSHRLRLLCKPLGIAKIDTTQEQVAVQFIDQPPIDPMRIIDLIQKDRNYRLAGQQKLVLKRACPRLAERVAAVKDIVHQLSRR
ncbi:MAG TPA: transcription-repair coupling factor, partial [Accumulibacter sp.]|nr:transcription-repair coupling factor [Accumulibacter sp.]